MNLLVVGSGGREHALIYKLKQSPLCEKYIVLPETVDRADCDMRRYCRG